MNKKLLLAALCMLSALTMHTSLESKTVHKKKSPRARSVKKTPQPSILKPQEEIPSSIQLAIKATITPEEIEALTEQVGKGENLDKAADVLLNNTLTADSDLLQGRLFMLGMMLQQNHDGNKILITKTRSALKSTDNMMIAAALQIHSSLIGNNYTNSEFINGAYQAALKHYKSDDKLIQKGSFRIFASILSFRNFLRSFVISSEAAEAYPEEYEGYSKMAEAAEAYKPIIQEIKNIALQESQSDNIVLKRRAFFLLPDILKVDEQSLPIIEQRVFEAIDDENHEIKAMGLWALRDFINMEYDYEKILRTAEKAYDIDNIEVKQAAMYILLRLVIQRSIGLNESEKIVQNALTLNNEALTHVAQQLEEVRKRMNQQKEGE